MSRARGKVRRGEDVEDWGEGRECRGLGGGR